MLVDNAHIVKYQWANHDLRISCLLKCFTECVLTWLQANHLQREKMSMLMISMLSGGRNSPCLITRAALGQWPRHRITQKYSRLFRSLLIIIMMGVVGEMSYHHSHHEYGFRPNPWNEYGFWGKSGRISAKGYIGSSIPNLLKPVVKWYTGSNIPKRAAQAGKLTNGA